MATSHRFVEPRWCAICDDHADPDELVCNFCDGPTRLLSDVMEARWSRQQEDALSEPPVTMIEAQRAAYLERQRVRGF